MACWPWRRGCLLILEKGVWSILSLLLFPYLPHLYAALLESEQEEWGLERKSRSHTCNRSYISLLVCAVGTDTLDGVQVLAFSLGGTFWTLHPKQFPDMSIVTSGRPLVILLHQDLY